MDKSRDKIRQWLVVTTIGVWLVGLLLLPDGILTDYYDYVFGDSYLYDALNPIIGAMYVSLAAFVIPMALFSMLLDDKSGVAPKMTLAFYIGITIVFVAIAFKKTEFIYSAIAMVVCVVVATYLVVTDKKQNCPTVK